MTEKQFQTKVIKWLTNINAYVVNVWGGGYQTAGIPDLLVCYEGKYLAIELKTEKGKVSVLQKWNIQKIKDAGGVAIILRPSEFENFKKGVINGGIFLQ